MTNSIPSSESLEDLFMKHYRTLCQLSYSIVRNMDVSKDIVQDFFVKYWEKHHGNSRHIRFEQYAYVAVRNRSFNHLESQKTRQRHLKQLMHTVPESDLSLAERETDTGDSYHIRLIKAIDNLPDQQRRIFLLSTSQGLKYSQIAEKLNISVNTVKTQIKRAYLSIRKKCDVPVLIFILMLIRFLPSPFCMVCC